MWSEIVCLDKYNTLITEDDKTGYQKKQIMQKYHAALYFEEQFR